MSMLEKKNIFLAGGGGGGFGGNNNVKSPYNCLKQSQEPLSSPHLNDLSVRRGLGNAALE